jgi:glycosyltransferase involved in cell wall biosynthesis
MSDKKLPISVNICVLNEGDNIRLCIESVIKNNPKEIIVVDGGSTDNTIDVLSEYPITIIHSKKSGLSTQRQLAIDNSSEPYIAIVDGDDILEPDFLSILVNEIKEYDFDALQGREVSYSAKGYFEKAMGAVNSQITFHNKPKETNMVGRPSLYKANALKKCGFDSFFDGVGDEDTDLSIRMEYNGFRQGFGSGLTNRKQTVGFVDTFKKFRKYGRGDARIIYKYPEKRKKIFFHLMIRYPIIRMFKSLFSKNFIYAPVFSFIGIVRSYYMVINFLPLIIQKPKFKKYK